MEIGAVIAINLRRIRAEQNLSLGELAKRAGVSKVMLSQLEKGMANPTINTIWKITGALQLPYTSLLELPSTGALHVKKGQARELAEEGFHIFSYFPKTGERPFELYQIELEPGCDHGSIGHSSHSTEYIMAVEGCLELTVNGELHRLEPDDGFCFEASVPHRYQNSGSTVVKLVMMIFYNENTRPCGMPHPAARGKKTTKEQEP